MFFAANGNIDHGGELIGLVAEIVEQAPDAFKSSVLELVSLLDRIQNKSNVLKNSDLRENILEITVSLTIKYPAITKKHEKIMEYSLDLLIDHILTVPDEPSLDWQNPPDGYDEKKSELDGEKIVEFVLERLDAICGNVGVDLVLKHLNPRFEKLVKSGDDKKVFVAFLAISHLGEHIDTLSSIQNMFKKSLEFVDHSQVRVRYSVIFFIGFILHDNSPEFQTSYHKSIFPVLNSALEDSSPRVVSEACLAISEFFSGFDDERLVQNYLNIVFDRLLKIVSESSIFVLENAIRALWTVCVKIPEINDSRYESVIELMLSRLESAANPQLKKYRGNLIEGIASLCQKVGLSTFEKYSERYIRELLKVHENFLSDKEDPQRNFLLMGWPKVSEGLGASFSKHLPEIFGPIFKMCKTASQRSLDIEKELSDEKNEKLLSKIREESAYYHDELSSAISLLSCLVEDHPSSMISHFDSIRSFVVEFLDFEPEEDVRESAIESIPVLLHSLRTDESRKGEFDKIAKELIQELLQAMRKESNSGLMVKAASSLSEVIEKFDLLLTEEEVNGIAEEVFYHFNQSEKRIEEETENDFEGQEDGEEESDGLPDFEKKVETEQELQCALEDVLSKLFQTQKERSIKVYEKVHSTLIGLLLKKESSPHAKKVGLFFICDIVDHLGFALPQDRILSYLESYITLYLSSEYCLLRQSAAYCMGSIAQVLKEKFVPHLETSLTLLKKAYKIERNEDEDEEDYRTSCDNVVSSVGKIIKSTWSFVPQATSAFLFDQWIDTLPIRYDTIEAVVSHEYMMNIVYNMDIHTLSNDRYMRRVVSIMISIYGSDTSSVHIDGIIVSCISKWSTDPRTSTILDTIDIPSDRRVILNNIIQHNR